jgi:hypothetical protein
MKICVLGYGLVWSTRTTDQRRAAAYFNTTGVVVHGKPRPRSCIYGHVRIDQCSGFRPELAARTIHRVFEAEGVTVWSGRRKLFLRTLHPKGTTPDHYLVRVSDSELGCINRSDCWLCEAGEIVSFSDGNDQQEVLLVLPAFGWVRSSLGVFYLMPNPDRPCMAQMKRFGE